MNRRIGLIACVAAPVMASFPAHAGLLDRYGLGDQDTPYTAEEAAILDAGTPLPGRYIVTLDSALMTVLGQGSLESSVKQLLTAVGGGTLLYLYEHALTGAALAITDDQAQLLTTLPGVLAIEQDQVVTIGSQTQAEATWGLDRIDQRFLPLDEQFTYPAHGGEGANIYILDTGLRDSHDEFAGRIIEGRNFAVNDTGLLGLGGVPLVGPILNIGGETDPEDTTDCNGHGTHVASTAAGTQFGVAKQAKIAAVRVLDCSGAGSTAGVIVGVDWVTEHHVAPAVANMSLGGGNSEALDNAVRGAVNTGITVVVAAGNSNADACNGSPNRVAEAVTVGSTTAQDRRSSFSNHGACVDIFAPGSDITAAWHQSDDETNTISGTSMAAPHAAGAAALLLTENPDLPPVAIMEALLGNATTQVLSGLEAGSPNKLLYVEAP